MPIPLLGIIAGLAAGAGAVKTIDAVITNDEAKDIQREAEKIVDRSKRNLNQARESANNEIKQFAKTRFYIMDNNFSDFINNYSRIRRTEDSGLSPNSATFIEMKNAISEVKKLVSSSGSIDGIATGTLLAAGTYGIVGSLATASTGTAIGALSGIAARNATLSWLGGGSIAAGGAGIWGGIATMGGIFAAPVFLITGFKMSEKANKALDDAKSNRKMAETGAEKVKDICSKLKAIEGTIYQANDLLKDLDSKFYSSNWNMKQIINNCGTNFHDYTWTDKSHIKNTVQIAKTIRNIMDSKMYDPGNLELTYQGKNAINEGRALLSNLN